MISYIFDRNGVQIQYVLLRLMNVAIKPLFIFVCANFHNELVASNVAIAFTMGSWLMAPMSLGAYRWLVPLEQRLHARNSSKLKHLKYVYAYIVFISISIHLPATYLFIYLLSHSHFVSLLATLTVLYEFLTHEQSRRILYSGNLSGWARFIFLRSLWLVLSWSVGIAVYYCAKPNWFGFASIEYMIAASFIPLLAVIINFLNNQWVWGVNVKLDKATFSLSISRINKFWLFSFCGLISKVHQHIDKLLVAFFSPEDVWIVSILGYIFMSAPMSYEMIYVAKLKSSIIQSTKAVIKSNALFVGREALFCFSVLLCGALLVLFFGRINDVDTSFYITAFVFAVFAYLQCVSLKKTELIFWATRSSKLIATIDIFPALLTTILGCVIVYIFPSIMLVKVSAVLGVLVRIHLCNVRILKEA